MEAGLALLCPHPEEHCVITETRHQSFQQLPQTLPGQPQLPPGLGGWGTCRPGMTPVQCCWEGVSASKILENIRLWGPSGEKGLRVGNNLIFGQREKMCRFQFLKLARPKAEGRVAPDAWVASWEKRQVSLQPHPKKAVGRGRPCEILGEDCLVCSGPSYPCPCSC